MELLKTLNEGIFGDAYYNVSDDIKQQITKSNKAQFDEVESLAHAFGPHDPFTIRVNDANVVCVIGPTGRTYKVPGNWDIATMQRALPKLNIDPPA